LRMGLQDILPAQSALLPNFPNPFNPETTIPFAIGAGDHTRVELAIFNALGQRVRTLFAGSLTAGLHRIQWDGRSDAGHEVATGAYIYRLEVGQHVETRRLLLLR
jgi:flagellar hook assembly protein FlgD